MYLRFQEKKKYHIVQLSLAKFKILRFYAMYLKKMVRG